LPAQFCDRRGRDSASAHALTHRVADLHLAVFVRRAEEATARDECAATDHVVRAESRVEVRSVDQPSEQSHRVLIPLAAGWWPFIDSDAQALCQRIYFPGQLGIERGSVERNQDDVDGAQANQFVVGR